MKYLNLKKITAVVLSIGMVFSSSAVTGFAADNSKKIATIPNSYINKVADDIDDKYFYIESKNSGKVIDVKNQDTQNGTIVYQWEYNGQDNQLWYFEMDNNTTTTDTTTTITAKMNKNVFLFHAFPCAIKINGIINNAL